MARTQARTAQRRVNSKAEKARNRAAVQRNRERTFNMTRGFVIFLCVISVATIFMCVQYLTLRSAVTSQQKAIASAEAELVSARSENDALLENITNQIDWEEIRRKATEELGMKYPDEDQIVWYNSSESSQVRQYQEVPTSKE